MRRSPKPTFGRETASAEVQNVDLGACDQEFA